MMIIIVIIYSSVIHCVPAESSGFVIEDARHYPVGVEDVGIRFYLTALSVALSNVTIIKVKDPECCWQVEPNDIDCESMELFGGFPVTIPTGQRRNISYVFSNMYPLDRKGSCKFFLKENDRRSVHLKIVNFDTAEKSVKDIDVRKEVIYQSCLHVDQNKRNSCHPFSCAKKYNGYRNYYRKSKGKCEAVVRCKTLLGNDKLPTSAFDIDNNRCKSLLPKISKSDKDTVTEMMGESKLANEFKKYDNVDPHKLIIDCKHGKQVGQHCRCDEGWRTVSMTTVNGGIIMDWCSRKTKKISPKLNQYIIVKYVLLVLLVVICSCMVLFLIVLWWRFLLSNIFTKLTLWFWKSKKPALPCFSFSYNPLWEIDGKTYNSNVELEEMMKNVDDDNDDFFYQVMEEPEPKIIGIDSAGILTTVASKNN